MFEDFITEDKTTPKTRTIPKDNDKTSTLDKDNTTPKTKTVDKDTLDKINNKIDAINKMNKRLAKLKAEVTRRSN